MAAHVPNAFLDIESIPPSPLYPPPKARAKVRAYHSDPHDSEAVELETIQNGADNSQKEGVVAGLPNDIEMSQPPSPLNQTDSVDIVQSFSNPPMNRYRMLAVCLMTFANGLNDSAPGALIPYIERYIICFCMKQTSADYLTHYDLGYALVSLIFVTVALGFITFVFFVDALRAYLGRSKTLMLAQLLMLCGYVPIVCTPPFAVVVVAFFFVGFGIAVNLAIGNVFTANLRSGTEMLGFMHGSYGVGGYYFEYNPSDICFAVSSISLTT